MTNRYADDIRRIVGIEEEDGSLAEPKVREPISGGRGVGYYSGGGNGQSAQVSSQSGFPSGGGAGLPGSSANNPQGDSSNNTAGSEGAASGGTSEGREEPFNFNDPNSLITEFGNSNVDIAEVMDNWSFNSLDALRTVTGVDPTSSTDYELHLTGNYPPPEGWDDPNVPPGVSEDTTFQPGFYWEHFAAIVIDKFQSPAAAHSAFVDAHTAATAVFGDAYEYDDVEQIAVDTYQSCFRQIQSNGNPIPPGPTVCIPIGRSGCTGGDPSGPGDYCSLIPPEIGVSPDFWPELDKVIAIYNGGSTETNQYQNPADLVGFTQDGVSKVNLESKTDPGRYFSIEPSGTGGTLVYETSGPGGPQIGVFKTFSPNGQFTGYGDSTSIDYVRP